MPNIDEVLSINPYANVFIFGDFNIHHKGWLTYSGGTDRPGGLCHNFSISKDVTQMVNFPTWILSCDSHSLLFWIYLFLLMLVFVLHWPSLYLEILMMLLPQFPSTFQQAHIIAAYDCSYVDWDSLSDHLRDVPCEDIFKLSVSAAASEFCE